MKKSVVFSILIILLFITACENKDNINPILNSSKECQRSCHVYIEDSNPGVGCYPANEPLICTEEYRMGDVCLKYVSCVKNNDSCEAITNERFGQCIQCVKECSKKDSLKNDPFECTEQC